MNAPDAQQAFGSLPTVSAPGSPAPLPPGPDAMGDPGEIGQCCVESTTSNPGPPPPPPPDPAGAAGDPEEIGRYRVVRKMGEGGFGRVYQALDVVLDRMVAIKVPRPGRIARPEDIAVYLKEAKIVAQFKHRGIVQVFDFGRTDDGLCYVVSEAIEGEDLAAVMRAGRPPLDRAAGWVAAIAEALHHAHKKNVFHRDVKPSNILIDASGQALLTDFGVALTEEDFGKGTRNSGTVAYMSPEQARGEGHLVDGRSDIFSLGVVLFELLVGRRPFLGDTPEALCRRIATTEARPPRQIDDTVPRELERICLKALARRATDRYPTAKDFAEDLRHFLDRPAGSREVATPSEVSPPCQDVPPHDAADEDKRPLKVNSKGLLSFDAREAGEYLELLPGPRDRHGLPESLRFWKDLIEGIDPEATSLGDSRPCTPTPAPRIAEHDDEATFRVGLIYGPSGCGKSSLIRAGLLPILAGHVSAVYVEATADDTEAQLLKRLRRYDPDLPATLGLVEVLTALRTGRAIPAGLKVLIVLDQFEQWLIARRGPEDPELVVALRQCDGVRVQALVLVRDDFWMAATRFLRDLEVDLVPGRNVAAVDLFDPRHAVKVLTAFGRAFGALPDGDLTGEQQAFLDRAVASLAQEGRVIPVRLSLFAEMVKGRSWSRATLQAIGGADGVGVTFLEETFSTPQANPRYRLHEEAVRSVLATLLPSNGTDLRGHVRSRRELLEASGYAECSREFDDLMRILNVEARLITPTDPEGRDDDPAGTRAPDDHRYQLTHDFLVPSLREWLTRKQRESRRGRAELCLAERSVLWNAKPETRYLPSAWEWASIRLRTDPGRWTDAQRRMMRTAGRVHTMRGLVALLLLTGAFVAGLALRRQAVERERATHAAGLVQQVLRAETAKVPEIIAEMRADRSRIEPTLRQELAQAKEGSSERLRVSLALFPWDDSQAEHLFGHLLKATPTDLLVIGRMVAAHRWGDPTRRDHLADRLWGVLTQPGERRPRLRAAGALALIDPRGSRWPDVAGKVADNLVEMNPVELDPWIVSFRDVRHALAKPLGAILRDPGRSDSERSLAAYFLVDYVRDEGELTDLLLDAEPRQFSILFPKVGEQGPRALDRLETVLAERPAADASRSAEDRLARRRANAAVALILLDCPDDPWPRPHDPEAAWALLHHDPDPTVRSEIVNRLGLLEVDPWTIAEKLKRINAQSTPTPAPGPSTMDAILFHGPTSLRRALILALGGYEAEQLLPEDQTQQVKMLLDLYRTDPDAGIHGAAEWTLRRWGQEAALAKADEGLMKATGPGPRRWLVNSQGQTMVLIQGPVGLRTDSPRDGPDRREVVETPQSVRIGRSFAISSKEVTQEQYGRFSGENPNFQIDRGKDDPFRLGEPQVWVTWYQAAAYCNWLSEREGLRACYEPNSWGEFAEGMKLVPGVLDRDGYRLPTEAEWEYACRAGARTRRSYGNPDGLLARYAWSFENAEGRVQPGGRLKPNDLGLFDMHGNAWEWVLNVSRPHEPQEPGAAPADAIEPGPVGDDARTVRGGGFLQRPSEIRSAVRFGPRPGDRQNDFGFRIVRTYPRPAGE
jgi:serine/threonine protein kinase/formylglycine-generating enzyme required for sulfatase activity